jgi:hypothetical protein
MPDNSIRTAGEEVAGCRLHEKSATDEGRVRILFRRKERIESRGCASLVDSGLNRDLFGT